jgi:hypothetical protein
MKTKYTFLTISHLVLLTMRNVPEKIVGKIKTCILLSCITFWVVLRLMVFNSRRFETLSLPSSQASGCEMNDEGNEFCGVASR